MFSKTAQPNFPSNYSPYDVKLGVVKNPCRLKVNKCLLLFSWERGFSMGSSVTKCTWAIKTTQQVFDDVLWVNAFTNDIFAGVMASNTLNGL